ncbi:hypothetical protein T4D_1771 [Trichinella pseudospiralis]|uniref:Uncharacterized protein n=1 Tax=Trichinella pseudospiralis TaxID=6337 RepID=A0A0V1FQV8_TRIPS|nr:hypothetical protein T4D_1771 [Trichinella pseudospiralis]
MYLNIFYPVLDSLFVVLVGEYCPKSLIFFSLIFLHQKLISNYFSVGVRNECSNAAIVQTTKIAWASLCEPLRSDE